MNSKQARRPSNLGPQSIPSLLVISAAFVSGFCIMTNAGTSYASKHTTTYTSL